MLAIFSLLKGHAYRAGKIVKNSKVPEFLGLHQSRTKIQRLLALV